jgi:hypothetical protein
VIGSEDYRLFALKWGERLSMQTRWCRRDKNASVNIGRVWTDNLRPVIETVAHLLGYRFDDSDWSAFEAGLPSTDSEREPWFEYPLAEASVEVALEPGAEEMARSLHRKPWRTATRDLERRAGCAPFLVVRHRRSACIVEGLA